MADETPAQAPEVAQPSEAAPAPAPAPAAEATATESGAPTTDAKTAKSESAPAVETEKKDEEVKNAEDDKLAEGTCCRYRYRVSTWN